MSSPSKKTLLISFTVKLIIYCKWWICIN